MRKFLALTPLLFLLVVSPAVHAEQLEITAEGEYAMGDGETMAVAEDRALRKAQQSAAEQAGVFVKSYSRVKNLVLTEDVIEVVANHSMKVTIVARKKTVVGDIEAIKFLVRIKAVVKTEEIEANLRKVREDAGAVESYKKLKTEYDRQAVEIENLKKQLADAGADGRKQVLARISDEEKKFKANLWLEKGNDYSLGPEMALKAFNTALELNPDLAMAYFGKARLNRYAGLSCDDRLNNGISDCRKEIADLYQALADVNRAISMDVHYADAYALRAEITNDIRSVEWRVAYKKSPNGPGLPDINKNQKSILEDMDRAIALKPDSHNFYERRASYLDPVNDSEKQIADVTRAIELCRKQNCNLLIMYYVQRSGFYKNEGRHDLAREDERIMDELMKKSPAFRAFDPGESEFKKIQEEIYFTYDEEKRRKTLEDAKQRISAGRAEAHDYWARAMIGEDENSRMSDISEAVRLAEKKRPRDREAMKLAYMYNTRAAMLTLKKNYDAALNDVIRALAIVDPYLPNALSRFKYEDIEKIDDDKMNKLSRPEAEAVIWIFLKTSALRNRASVYEELNAPAKALADYKVLCTEIKDTKACKDVERLK